MSDWYLSNVTVIQTCLIAALLAMSLQVTMRVGVLSVAGIGFYGVSEYLTAIMVIHGYLPWPLAILASAVVCGVLAYLLARLLNRVGGLYLTMVTLGFVLVLDVVASNGGDLTGGPNGLYGFPVTVTTTDMLVVCGGAVLICGYTQRGSVGRAAEALRTDELLAASQGIEASRTRRNNFVLSGVLGALAGGLNVLTFGVVGPSDAGFPLTVTILTAVIVGGQRSWFGAVIGAFLITSLPTILSSFSGSTRDIAFGALVLILATFAPDGLLGFAHSLKRAVGRMRARAARRPRTVTKEPIDA
jgi:branched-chain amino acid transport system permease protein